MEKNTQFMNKVIYIVLMWALVSCRKDKALKEKILYVSLENKEWLSTDSLGTSSLMIDDNQISQAFSRYENSTDFSQSSTSQFGINTTNTKRESFSQGYSSTYGTRYSYLLTAGFSPYGDEISININKLSFAYDFKFKTITRVGYEGKYKSKRMANEGYEEREKILSTMDLLDSIEINGKKYSEILHFTLNDFSEEWSNLAIRELYIAKQYGLIKYSYQSKVTFARQK